MPKKQELRFCRFIVLRVSCRRQKDGKTHYYGDYNDNYEVCCGFVKGYVPVWCCAGLYCDDLVESCAPDVCGFYVE